jgi:hypothetical protein
VCRREVEQCSVQMVLHEVYGGRVIRASLIHIALVAARAAYPGTSIFAIGDGSDLWDLPPPAWRLLRFWSPSAHA